MAHANDSAAPKLSQNNPQRGQGPQANYKSGSQEQKATNKPTVGSNSNTYQQQAKSDSFSWLDSWMKLLQSNQHTFNERMQGLCQESLANCMNHCIQHTLEAAERIEHSKQLLNASISTIQMWTKCREHIYEEVSEINQSTAECLGEYASNCLHCKDYRDSISLQCHLFEQWLKACGKPLNSIYDAWTNTSSGITNHWLTTSSSLMEKRIQKFFKCL